MNFNVAARKFIDNKKLFFYTILCLFFISFLWYVLSPTKFYSESLLEIRSLESTDQGPLSSLQGISSIASSVGLSLPGGESNDFSKVIEMIKSRDIAYKVIKENNLSHRLLALKGFNRDKGFEIINNNKFDSSKNLFKGKFKDLSDDEILDLAYDEYMDITQVSPTQSGFVKLGVKSKSPKLSQDLIMMIKKSVNDEMKARDKLELERSVEYYMQKIYDVSDTSLKEALIIELLKQEKELMTINVRGDEYRASFLQKPNYPFSKFSPNLLFHLLGTFLIMFSFLALLAILL